MENEWQDYLETQAHELGVELAETFVDSLYEQSDGSIETARRFFYQLGEQWAPLICLFGAWAWLKSIGIRRALILRDAEPLGYSSFTQDWEPLFLNREICGIADELSGHQAKSPHPLLVRYLREHECAEGFAFIDSGCYGTVVLGLHKMGISCKPLFFFSKNPHIPGFLNKIGLTEKQGEILNDSLECGFPSIYRRPSELNAKEPRVTVELQSSDRLSVAFGWEARHALMRNLWWSSNGGIFMECARFEARKLLYFSELARQGQFTGILGQASPEWSRKKEFLENWPKELCWT